MEVCSSCGIPQQDHAFDGGAEWLKARPHLALERVCLSCRTRVIECKECGLEYPGVPRYFYRRTRKGRPSGKYGVRSVCKVCFSIKVSEARRKKKEGVTWTRSTLK